MKPVQDAQKRPSSERGTAILESAIVLLAFLLILFGILEAGRMMNVQQILTDAAREGARLGVAPLAGTDTLPNTTEIEAEVNRFLDAAHISGADIDIAPVAVGTGAVTTEFTKVTVTLSYSPITTSLLFKTSLTLKGEALMRNETSP